jgi:membrane dipeptidase
MARMRRELSLEPDKYVMVDTVDDIRAAKKSGKLSIGFHFQGTEAIGRDLANVVGFYKLGVRWMLMAYNFQNSVGTGGAEARLGPHEFWTRAYQGNESRRDVR